MKKAAPDRNDGNEMIVKRVSVPIGLEELMEDLAKEVLLKKPNDLYVFAAKYFSQLLLLRDRGDYKVKTVRSAHTVAEHNRKWANKKTINNTASKLLPRQVSIRDASTIIESTPNLSICGTRGISNSDRFEKLKNARNKSRLKKQDTRKTKIENVDSQREMNSDSSGHQRTKKIVNKDKNQKSTSNTERLRHKLPRKPLSHTDESSVSSDEKVSNKGNDKPRKKFDKYKNKIESSKDGAFLKSVPLNEDRDEVSERTTEHDKKVSAVADNSLVKEIKPDIEVIRDQLPSVRGDKPIEAVENHEQAVPEDGTRILNTVDTGEHSKEHSDDVEGNNNKKDIEHDDYEAYDINDKTLNKNVNSISNNNDIPINDVVIETNENSKHKSVPLNEDRDEINEKTIEYEKKVSAVADNSQDTLSSVMEDKPVEAIVDLKHAVPEDGTKIVDTDEHSKEHSDNLEDMKYNNNKKYIEHNNYGAKDIDKIFDSISNKNVIPINDLIIETDETSQHNIGKDSSLKFYKNLLIVPAVETIEIMKTAKEDHAETVPGLRVVPPDQPKLLIEDSTMKFYKQLLIPEYETPINYENKEGIVPLSAANIKNGASEGTSTIDELIEPVYENDTHEIKHAKEDLLVETISTAKDKDVPKMKNVGNESKYNEILSPEPIKYLEQVHDKSTIKAIPNCYGEKLEKAEKQVEELVGFVQNNIFVNKIIEEQDEIEAELDVKTDLPRAEPSSVEDDQNLQPGNSNNNSNESHPVQNNEIIIGNENLTNDTRKSVEVKNSINITHDLTFSTSGTSNDKSDSKKLDGILTGMIDKEIDDLIGTANEDAESIHLPKLIRGVKKIEQTNSIVIKNDKVALSSEVSDTDRLLDNKKQMSIDSSNNNMDKIVVNVEEMAESAHKLDFSGNEEIQSTKFSATGKKQISSAERIPSVDRMKIISTKPSTSIQKQLNDKQDGHADSISDQAKVKNIGQQSSEIYGEIHTKNTDDLSNNDMNSSSNVVKEVNEKMEESITKPIDTKDNFIFSEQQSTDQDVSEITSDSASVPFLEAVGAKYKDKIIEINAQHPFKSGVSKDISIETYHDKTDSNKNSHELKSSANTDDKEDTRNKNINKASFSNDIYGKMQSKIDEDFSRPNKLEMEIEDVSEKHKITESLSAVRMDKALEDTLKTKISSGSNLPNTVDDLDKNVNNIKTNNISSKIVDTKECGEQNENVVGSKEKRDISELDMPNNDFCLEEMDRKNEIEVTSNNHSIINQIILYARKIKITPDIDKTIENNTKTNLDDIKDFIKSFIVIEQQNVLSPSQSIFIPLKDNYDDGNKGKVEQQLSGDIRKVEHDLKDDRFVIHQIIKYVRNTINPESTTKLTDDIYKLSSEGKKLINSFIEKEQAAAFPHQENFSPTTQKNDVSNANTNTDKKEPDPPKNLDNKCDTDVIFTDSSSERNNNTALIRSIVDYINTITLDGDILSNNHTNANDKLTVESKSFINSFMKKEQDNVFMKDNNSKHVIKKAKGKTSEHADKTFHPEVNKLSSSIPTKIKEKPSLNGKSKIGDANNNQKSFKCTSSVLKPKSSPRSNNISRKDMSGKTIRRIKSVEIIGIPENVKELKSRIPTADSRYRKEILQKRKLNNSIDEKYVEDNKTLNHSRRSLYINGIDAKMNKSEEMEAVTNESMEKIDDDVFFKDYHMDITEAAAATKFDASKLHQELVNIEKSSQNRNISETDGEKQYTKVGNKNNESLDGAIDVKELPTKFADESEFHKSEEIDDKDVGKFDISKLHQELLGIDKLPQNSDDNQISKPDMSYKLLKHKNNEIMNDIKCEVAKIEEISKIATDTEIYNHETNLNSEENIVKNIAYKGSESEEKFNKFKLHEELYKGKQLSQNIVENTSNENVNKVISGNDKILLVAAETKAEVENKFDISKLHYELHDKDAKSDKIDIKELPHFPDQKKEDEIKSDTLTKFDIYNLHKELQGNIYTIEEHINHESPEEKSTLDTKKEVEDQPKFDTSQLHQELNMGIIDNPDETQVKSVKTENYDITKNYSKEIEAGKNLPEAENIGQNKQSQHKFDISELHEELHGADINKLQISDTPTGTVGITIEVIEVDKTLDRKKSCDFAKIVETGEMEDRKTSSTFDISTFEENMKHEIGEKKINCNISENYEVALNPSSTNEQEGEPRRTSDISTLHEEFNGVVNQLIATETKHKTIKDIVESIAVGSNSSSNILNINQQEEQSSGKQSLSSDNHVQELSKFSMPKLHHELFGDDDNENINIEKHGGKIADNKSDSIGTISISKEKQLEAEAESPPLGNHKKDVNKSKLDHELHDFIIENKNIKDESTNDKRPSSETSSYDIEQKLGKYSKSSKSDVSSFAKIKTGDTPRQNFNISIFHEELYGLVNDKNDNKSIVLEADSNSSNNMLKHDENDPVEDTKASDVEQSISSSDQIEDIPKFSLSKLHQELYEDLNSRENRTLDKYDINVFDNKKLSSNKQNINDETLSSEKRIIENQSEAPSTKEQRKVNEVITDNINSTVAEFFENMANKVTEESEDNRKFKCSTGEDSIDVLKNNKKHAVNNKRSSLEMKVKGLDSEKTLEIYSNCIGAEKSNSNHDDEARSKFDISNLHQKTHGIMNNTEQTYDIKDNQVTEENEENSDSKIISSISTSGAGIYKNSNKKETSSSLGDQTEDKIQSNFDISKLHEELHQIINDVIVIDTVKEKSEAIEDRVQFRNNREDKLQPKFDISALHEELHDVKKDNKEIVDIVVATDITMNEIGKNNERKLKKDIPDNKNKYDITITSDRSKKMIEKESLVEDHIEGNCESKSNEVIKEDLPDTVIDKAMEDRENMISKKNNYILMSNEQDKNLDLDLALKMSINSDKMVESASFRKSDELKFDSPTSPNNLSEIINDNKKSDIIVDEIKENKMIGITGSKNIIKSVVNDKDNGAKISSSEKNIHGIKMDSKETSKFDISKLHEELQEAVIGEKCLSPTKHFIGETTEDIVKKNNNFINDNIKTKEHTKDENDKNDSKPQPKYDLSVSHEELDKAISNKQMTDKDVEVNKLRDKGTEYIKASDLDQTLYKYVDSGATGTSPITSSHNKDTSQSKFNISKLHEDLNIDLHQEKKIVNHKSTLSKENINYDKSSQDYPGVSKVFQEFREIQNASGSDNLKSSYDPHKLRNDINQARIFKIYEIDKKSDEFLKIVQAVIKIQSFWKGFVVRKHIPTNHQTKTFIDKKSPSDSNSNRLMMAAVKIQKFWRVFQSRENKHFFQSYESSSRNIGSSNETENNKSEKHILLESISNKSSILNPEYSKQKLANSANGSTRSAELDEEIKSAIKIQSRWRVFLSKKLAKELRLNRSGQKMFRYSTTNLNEDEAAIKISAESKGYLQRKNCTEKHRTKNKNPSDINDNTDIQHSASADRPTSIDSTDSRITVINQDNLDIVDDSNSDTEVDKITDYQYKLLNQISGHNDDIVELTANNRSSNNLSQTPLPSPMVKNSQLLHSSELHDSIILPVEMEIYLDDNDIKDKKENDNAKQENLGQINFANTGLLHTSEMHDLVVIPTFNVENHNATIESIQLTDNGLQSAETVLRDRALGISTSEDGSNNKNVSNEDGQAQASTMSDATVDVTVEAHAPSKADLDEVAQPELSQTWNFQSMASEKRAQPNSSTDKNMEAEAATKIQAGFRGYKVRKQLKMKNGLTEGEKQRRPSRTKISAAAIPRDVEEQSAVKIQAGIRGFLVRRRQKRNSDNNK